MNNRQERSIELEHWKNTGMVLPGAGGAIARYRAAVAAAEEVAKNDPDAKGYCGTCGACSDNLDECPVCGGRVIPVEVVK